MSDDPVLKMCEVQAELRKIKEEMKEIQKKNDQLKNEIIFKNLTETVNEVQSKVDVLQQTVTASSNKVSNYDEIFSELDENLRKINETFNQYDTILSQHNDVPAEQNETTQVFNTSENNFGKQTILLVGGKDCMDDDGLLVLENNGQDWKELNIKLPYTIEHHGAQFLNNNLYIFGGVKGKEGTLNSTYKLSKSLQWEKMADMHQERSEISNSSVILNNQIWVCGGRNEEGSLNTVEMYDPETNEWKFMEEMNECRENAAATVVNGKIFCSGGINENYTVLGSVECYDPSSDVWTLICDMPELIWGHGAVELNGNFIVMGGDHQSSWQIQAENSRNVWELDTTDKNAVWIEKSSMVISRKWFSIAKIDGKIFVCGGHFAKTVNDFEVFIREGWHTKEKYFDDVEIFDGEVWRNGPKMPTSRCDAPAVVIPMSFARYLN